MQGFLMKPKVDFAFKEIMKDEKARSGFISTVLGIPQEEIKESRLIDTHLSKKYPDEKLGIVDVRVQLRNGTEIDIEIQIAKLSVWAERSLFYVSKMYTDQIKSGDEYEILNKCVSISVLDFRLFEDSEEFYSCFHISEDSRHSLFTDKMEFHVIELPKLPKNIQTDSKLTLWAKFINAERKEEFDMIAEKDECIDSAYQRLQSISLDEQKRLEYEARDKAIRDHKQFMIDRARLEKKVEESIREVEESRRELEESRREAEESRRKGRQEGEQMLALLIERLTDDGRVEDMRKVLVDSDAREEFYKEYGIKALLK